MSGSLTRLSEDAIRDAEAALLRLGEVDHSLLFCVEYTLKHYRAPEAEKPLVDAVTDYIATKTREHERELLSGRQVRSISFELGHLKQAFAKGPVSNIIWVCAAWRMNGCKDNYVLARAKAAQVTLASWASVSPAVPVFGFAADGLPNTNARYALDCAHIGDSRKFFNKSPDWFP